MKRLTFKNAATLLLALALVFTFIVLSHASPRQKRGDYPRCQEECLTQLTKRMTELKEEYGRTGNRVVYQERVEQARFVYDACITNCKELLPVK